MHSIISMLENLTKSRRRLLAIALYGGFLWFSVGLGNLLTWVTNLIEKIVKIETAPSHVLAAVGILLLVCLPYFLPSFISFRQERFKLMVSVLRDLIVLKINASPHTFEGDCTSAAKFIASVAGLSSQLDKWNIWHPELVTTDDGVLFQKNYKRWKLYCAKLIQFASDGKVKKAALWASPKAMKDLEGC